MNFKKAVLAITVLGKKITFANLAKKSVVALLGIRRDFKADEGRRAGHIVRKLGIGVSVDWVMKKLEIIFGNIETIFGK